LRQRAAWTPFRVRRVGINTPEPFSTSFAFILGVVPLMVSVGAGAEMRRTLGTAVFSGMLGVTLFGIFLTPVFYYVIQWAVDSWPRDSERVVRVVMEPPQHMLPHGNGSPNGAPASRREATGKAE
jgi:AcrB/AcrD/AcrF family